MIDEDLIRRDIYERYIQSIIEEYTQYIVKLTGKTQEGLEKLAEENYPYPDDDADTKRKAFIEGYLKALEDVEKTNKQ